MAKRDAAPDPALVGWAFDYLHEGLMESDLERRIIYINEFGAQLAGFETASQMVATGVRTTEFFADEVDAQRILQAVDGQGMLVGYVCRMRDRTGQSKWIECTVKAVRTGSGKRVGAWAVFHDLTPRREAEEVRDQLHQELLGALSRIEESERHLIQKNRELERRNADLREFSAMVSHELRTPIMSLKGFSEILNKEYGARLDERGLHLVDRIHHNAIQMDRIVRGIQEVVLVGVTAEAKVWNDPNEVAADFQRDCATRLAGEGVKLVIRPDLPEVLAGPVKFQQLLFNLLDNAVKFSSQRPDARVELGYAGSPDEGHFYCEDSGPGVRPEDQPRVFELFYRASRERPGAGIGLAVVRRVLDACGGTIWIEDAQSGGARFCFRVGEKIRTKASKT